MNSLTHLIPLPDRDIIIRYKATLNGLLNYYAFVDNIYQFSKIFWILRESLRLTISRKHKLHKMEFERKYGGNKSSIVVSSIGKKDKKAYTKFETPSLKRNPMMFSPTIIPRDPTDFLNMEVRTKNDFGKPCSSCGSTDRVEMHHLKHIRTINLKLNAFDQKMAKKN